MGQFWLARFEKQPAERFAGSQSRPLARCAKCIVRRWWSCISQRGREARNGSQNAFGGSSSDPCHANGKRRLLLARQLRVCWDGLIDLNSQPWSCQCAGGIPYAEALHWQEWASRERGSGRIQYICDETETQNMKYKQSSRDNQRFVKSTTPCMRPTLLIWSVVLLVAGVGSAQTTPSQSPSTKSRPAPVQTGPAQATSAQVKPARATPTQTGAAAASAVATNAPPGQAERLLQVQPRPSFLGGVPELAFNEPKANELTWGRHAYSGIVVQVIKAHRRLQLLNPAAPSRYGSGWDNLERFPATGSGPMLKLFSISF